MIAVSITLSCRNRSQLQARQRAGALDRRGAAHLAAAAPVAGDLRGQPPLLAIRTPDLWAPKNIYYFKSLWKDSFHRDLSEASDNILGGPNRERRQPAAADAGLPSPGRVCHYVPISAERAQMNTIIAVVERVEMSISAY